MFPIIINGADGSEKIPFAVIDLNTPQPVLGGINYDNFIYPASVHKMYIAMEVLKQVSNSQYSLYDQYVVKSPNDVDPSKEIKFDPRPLLNITPPTGFMIKHCIVR